MFQQEVAGIGPKCGHLEGGLWFLAGSRPIAYERMQRRHSRSDLEYLAPSRHHTGGAQDHSRRL